ncbi:MAG: leucine--tRNA ligase [Chloroflexi bacterium]|nr:leucine--tRNA ligase [Chloroflexota bacterium]
MQQKIVPIYEPVKIEKKWQKTWEDLNQHKAVIDPDKPKHYALTMLPYPSGNLHIGHWYAITPSDAHARFMRMNGYNVMFPMGFDAFGLPAENAAIKNNIHPKQWTFQNISHMREQLKTMGCMFDWDREIISSEPDYYHWTQWFFLKLYENGLAYQKFSPVDWCPTCNTTLAREQVWGDDRHCERCETPVIKKDLNQWYFRITNYADELRSFDGIDWPERVQTLQNNWIGKSFGALVTYKTEYGDPLEVFTTRPDTLWGVTFMVLAPEHPLVAKLTRSENSEAVQKYIDQAKFHTDIQRESLDREKTGVFTGSYAINPVNEERIPIWIADYVLMGYGTGAVMGVPAHDQRDFEFARKFGLKIRVVIQPEGTELLDADTMTASVPAIGAMVNSGDMTGTPGDEAIDKVIDWLEERQIGKRTTTYRLRDWLISRQRYWGAPIPIIHCPKCGIVPVPESELPVRLPDDVEWKPTGESPLRLHPTWKHVNCPKCGEPAERETDTMDTFMCSSWYHLGYLSPYYPNWPFKQEEYDYWMPVDIYTGGIEHATMHLIYTRFFHKAFRDIGILKGNEPMLMLRNQGTVLGEDNEKMSKSRGNVVDPDKLVNSYGADTVRAYLMFFARWELGAPWNSSGIEGSSRWIRRIWSTVLEPAETKKNIDPEVFKVLKRRIYQTVASVTRDFQHFQFNTIVSSLMEMLNEMIKAKNAGAYGTTEWNEAVDIYLRLAAPIIPHITEELYALLGNSGSIHLAQWPEMDEEAAKEELITLVVQINGKLRGRLVLPAGSSEEVVKEEAMKLESVSAMLDGKEPKKLIVVPNKLINIVV